MDPATFDNLQEIRRRHPIEFGKICQILLAIACVRVGFRRVVERCVQGVDIDAGEHATFPNLAIEVKTTLSGKGITGLRAEESSRYEELAFCDALGVIKVQKTC